MNARICSVIASVTLMAFSTGCSGTRNFLFGRGARCGLCTKKASVVPAPQFGNTMPALQPYAPVSAAPCQTAPCPSAPCQAPAYQGSVVTAPQSGCGCNGVSGIVSGGGVYTGNACGSCGDYGVSYGGGCNSCGNAAQGYVTDPYLNSGTVVGEVVPHDGQIIGEPVLGGQGIPSTSTPIQSDNFDARVDARKFDSDGNRILWEQPLPEGATAL